MLKGDCTYCWGSPDNLDDEEDFCPRCGQPSRAYMNLVEDDMRRNGELTEALMDLVVGP